MALMAVSYQRSGGPDSLSRRQDGPSFPPRRPQTPATGCASLLAASGYDGTMNWVRGDAPLPAMFNELPYFSRPLWVTGSTSIMAKFPVLPGIEALTASREAHGEGRQHH